MTDWIIPIIAVVISGLIFTLIDHKLGLVEKISSRIKSKALGIVLFILGAVLVGVLMALVSRVTLNISENELLADILGWVIMGAFMPFAIGGISSKSDTKESA